MSSGKTSCEVSVAYNIKFKLTFINNVILIIYYVYTILGETCNLVANWVKYDKYNIVPIVSMTYVGITLCFLGLKFCLKQYSIFWGQMKPS